MAPDCFLFRDACNVYVLRYGDCAIAVDFGTGIWWDSLASIGVRTLRHVVITHTHRDQVCGLYRRGAGEASIHVPAGDAALVQAEALGKFWATYQDGGCPSCYAAPVQAVPRARPDLAADTETVLGPARFCALGTPGHTPGALSYIVHWHGRDLAFCGDAVHADGTLHQPYHLEWDHWTPAGCVAAWQGLERLGYCHFDLLLPAHGPVVDQRPRRCVALTRRRVMAMIRAKGSVCAGARQRWVDTAPLACGARRVLPHLYQFGANSFLLVGKDRAGLVVDPQLADLDQLSPLLEESGVRHVQVATASHYHLDHSDGLNAVRKRYGAQVWLHPRVAEPLLDRDLWDVPWLPRESVTVDRFLPVDGPFSWGGYELHSHDFPGQTRWHAALHARVDGRRVLFSGDNFQPPTRWNGTGGFCAYNGSRFDDEGFPRSAALALEIEPDIVCNGHGCVYEFRRDHYRRILRWVPRAERAVRDLCPGADWRAQYDPRELRWEPFVLHARPGARLRAELVFTSQRLRPVDAEIRVIPPPGWGSVPLRAGGTVPGGRTRRWSFQVEVPAQVPAGRHLLSADVTLDGERRAEACVALVDVSGS